MFASGAKSTTQAFVEMTRQLIFEAARTSNAGIFGNNAQSASKAAAGGEQWLSIPACWSLNLHQLAEKPRDGGQIGIRLLIPDTVSSIENPRDLAVGA